MRGGGAAKRGAAGGQCTAARAICTPCTPASPPTASTAACSRQSSQSVKLGDRAGGAFAAAMETIVSSAATDAWRGCAPRLQPPEARPTPRLRQNAEIFTLTYGSMVRQLIADYEDVEEVNKQLDKMCAAAAAAAACRPAAPPHSSAPLRAPPCRAPAAAALPARRRGYSIGQRLIDEFLAKSKTQRCSDFREAADRIARVGFRMFLNTTATVANWNAEGTECSLVRGGRGAGGSACGAAARR